MSKRKPVAAGSTFHRLTFLKDSRIMYSEWFGFFQCTCGKQVELRIRPVVNGYTKSCGCYKLELLNGLPSRRKQAKAPLAKPITHG